jgi:hypothetical protein
MGSEIFLSARYRAESGLFSGGKLSRDQRECFTRLTPKQLSYIPIGVLPVELRDRIKFPEEASLKVHERVLRAGLSNLNGDTPVIEARVGEEFRTLTPEITKLSQLVPVMAQALVHLRRVSDDSVAGTAGCTNPNSRAGYVVTAMAQDLADARGVAVWLDGLDGHPDYPNDLGMFVHIDRFMGSTLDYITMWVPLGITVEEVQRFNI